PPTLHSFPTRRSSDLANSQELEKDNVLAGEGIVELCVGGLPADARGVDRRIVHHRKTVRREEAERQVAGGSGPAGVAADQGLQRSEEHTSELQSPYDL